MVNKLLAYIGYCIYCWQVLIYKCSYMGCLEVVV